MAAIRAKIFFDKSSSVLEILRLSIFVISSSYKYVSKSAKTDLNSFSKLVISLCSLIAFFISLTTNLQYSEDVFSNKSERSAGKAVQYSLSSSISDAGRPPNIDAKISQDSAASEESTYLGILRL